MNSPRFVSRINAELRRELGDDRIVAGAQVLAVPSRRVLSRLSAAVYLTSAIALVFMFVWARDHWHAGPALIGFAIAEAAAVALGLARIFVQRPMLLAITRRRLVCCRLSGPGKHATEVAAAPLTSARIIVYGSGGRDTTLRCVLPRFEQPRLTSVRGCEEDLDRVLAVAHSSGVRIHTAKEDASTGEPARRSAPPSSPEGPARRGTPERTTARPERRREYPGEHRRSERGGGEPTRS